MGDIVTTSNVVVWIFTALAIVATTLRLIARVKFTNYAGIDDILITFSLMIFVTAGGLYSWSASKGIGMHLADLEPMQALEAGRVGVISNAVSVHTFSWPKLSVVALLCRMFQPKRWVAVSFYTAVVLLICCSCLLTIFNFVQCKPAAGFWNPTIEAKCWPKTVFEDFGIFSGCFSAALDFTFAVYPITVLSGLNMKKEKKLSLCVIMGGGLIACVAAIVKTVQLSRLSSHNDITYDFAIIDIWQSVESGLIFLAACLPTLRPFFQYVRDESLNFSRALNSRNNSTTNTSSNASRARMGSDSEERKPVSYPSVSQISYTTNSSRNSIAKPVEAVV